jgi:hypothetical protein
VPVVDAAVVDQEQVARIAGSQLQSTLHMANGLKSAVDERLALQVTDRWKFIGYAVSEQADLHAAAGSGC